MLEGAWAIMAKISNIDTNTSDSVNPAATIAAARKFLGKN
jgi:hypothetical protein